MSNDLKIWKQLQSHYEEDIKNLHMRDLFESDEERGQKFSREFGPFFFDFSKNRITEKTLNYLIQLAKDTSLEEWRERLFSGEPINTTEGRTALHPALRGSTNQNLKIDGQSVAEDVSDTLTKIKELTQKITNDENVTEIVNIGIGGSDLGPRLICEALEHYNTHRFNTHFLSNIDPCDSTALFSELKPENTVFIVTSKSWSTLETIANAETCRKWAQEKLGESWVDHFIGVTGRFKEAQSFGIQEQHILPLPDWVGGRYSLWSSVGLPIALTLGFDNFIKLLEGAKEADTHFKNAALEDNIPVLMALIGIWNRNFIGLEAQAVLPYASYLRSLPLYLQQLDMESNGKSVDRDGKLISYQTAATLFGETGTNGQHAFHQLLHQGTQTILCDFIVSRKSPSPHSNQHEKLVANALAQARALMIGKTNKKELHKSFSGNRPSNFILLDEINPFNLGMLLAFYEHKIFVQGIIWNINSFDQWGVELGKTLAHSILEEMENLNHHDQIFDSSTKYLLEKITKV